MSAARLDSTDNVEKLLKAGANPNAGNHVSVFVFQVFILSTTQTTLAGTPTHIITTILVFLQENWTALMAASRNGKIGNVKLLLQYKADPDMQDDVKKISHSLRF